MAIDLSKFLARFVEEAREHVSKLNHGLLSLESHPGDLETLNAVFRSAHTLKGSSRMMKLTPITEVAHKVEEILDGLRGQRIQFSRELWDLLFRSVDIMSVLVEQAGAGVALSTDISVICNELDMAVAGGPTVAGGEAMLSKGGAEQTAVAMPVVSADAGSPPAAGQEAPPRASLPQAACPAPAQDMPPSGSQQQAADNTIRVSMAKLDQVIKLTGEMVSGHGRLEERLLEIKDLERLSAKCMELASWLNNGDSRAARADISRSTRLLNLRLKRLVYDLTEDGNALDLLTQELQEDALGMRMLPLSSLFDSLRRIVRDLSRSLGKKVELITEGGETELDKKMIEKIGDPLIHMIRNAIDHGIEAPEARLKAGKAESGVLRLSAQYEGENVLIKLRDDGAGISLTRLKEKCLQKRLFSEEELNAMPEGELVNVIFQPGFSTSEIITDISGRGVGMDVVRKNIVDHLKGSVQVVTKEEEGTTVYIRLLLTLAIMHVLLVSVSDMSFALPASAVTEIVRIPESSVIEVVDRKAIRLREQIIPLADLEDILGLPVRDRDAGMGVLVLVVNVEGKRLGLAVDSVLSEENVVIKPLPPHMQNNRLVSGVTTTAKEIISVLNMTEVMQAAAGARIERRKERTEAPAKRTIHILVVDDSVNTREIEKSILEAYGYSVTLAGDGIEALEKTGGFQYDIIVTDVEMPRLDGFSLTERLRRDDQYKDTPIILVTSRDKESDKKRGIQVGANAYIVKGSFDQSNLLDTIKNFVG